mmetsp:Transcript_10661/g.23568  ORF Transcript_10661/g.23568 Transcript_10661/m.23568 type:complete len:413 (-) Transcript_10661:79-1317(-)
MLPFITVAVLYAALHTGSLVGVNAFAVVHPWKQSTVPLHSTKKDDAESSIDQIRAAVFQAPAQSNNNLRPENALTILTQAADVLRVASAHGVDVVLFPQLYLSGGGSERALDRESYELNIIGNVCGELNIACILGYAEIIHESELKKGNNSEDGRNGWYNSIAAFHADGTRAGNYRSISTTDAANLSDKREFRKGHPFVEAIPTTLQLPTRQETSIHKGEGQREIKVGMMCGNDVLNPELCRHLVRSGAQALFSSASFQNTEDNLRKVRCVIPTRAMENNVPFLVANFVQPPSTEDATESAFIGSSGIVSRHGSQLVCGPQEEDGDLPCDSGYLIPCTSGALYAADVQLLESEISGTNGSAIQQSMNQWDLTPRIPNEVSDDGRGKQSKQRGFGRDTKKKGKVNKFKLREYK